MFRKLLIAVGLMLCIPVAYALQERLTYYQPGFRLIDGSKLNKMVDIVNSVAGNGTAGPIATTNITGASGASADIQINGDAAITCASYYFTGTPAATDQVFFIATRAYVVKEISEVHSVAAGGASALQVVKDATTDAPGAGTDLLTNNTNTGFDLAATANTVQVGTLVSTAGVTTLAAGNRLSIDFANAIQSSAGVVVTVCMAPR